MTLREAVEQAYVANRKRHNGRYSATPFETAASLASSIEIPFGPGGHSLLWVAEAHGASFFEQLADQIESLGRVDMSKTLQKAADIADRALSPDAPGDSEHPDHRKLVSESAAIEREFTALGGVKAFQDRIETYLNKHYPWAI